MEEYDHSNSSGSESSDSEPELMITTRERRKTAGNRYSQVVAQEQAEEDEQDDVALLFAEADGEDEEYNSDEADDEAEMSSSDDDDQGPNAAPDDLDGEQELEKQAKVERQKKRKADMALTTMSGIRKRPKIDPTSLHRAPDRPKPSKRKERVSWMPDSDAAPGRTSLRKQTVAHREIMLERLKENEEQRLKHKAQREQKERLKQAEAPKEMTQADRLAEAERIERKNAKSLNRWEATEKRRAEEQAAKLAALKERKLEGAVLTFHSSIHVYRGPKVERVSPGPGGAEEVQAKKRGPKPKALKALMQASSAAANSVPVSSPLAQVKTQEAQPAAGPPSTISRRVSPESTGSKPQNDGWLAGIHDFATAPSAPGYVPPNETQRQHSMSEVKQEEEGREILEAGSIANHATDRKDGGSADGVMPQQKDDQTEALVPSQPPPTIEAVPEKPPNTSENTPHVQTPPLNPPLQAVVPVTTLQPVEQASDPQSTVTTTPNVPDETLPAQEVPPEIEVTSTRNLIILERFEELAADAMQTFNFLYNKKSTKAARPAKTSAELCAISGLPAKYRDPESRVGYANIAAFKKLREAQKHTFQWSSMLNCYVGRVGHVARGVPDGFLSPNTGT